MVLVSSHMKDEEQLRWKTVNKNTQFETRFVWGNSRLTGLNGENAKNGGGLFNKRLSENKITIWGFRVVM